MTEMRRILGVLRTGAGERLRRSPGSTALGELLEAARGAGTPVRLVLEGRVAPLAPGVELTAYRIVQEALTNARRHAPGAAVDVELHYGAGCAAAARARRRARARATTVPAATGCSACASGSRRSAAR